MPERVLRWSLRNYLVVSVAVLFVLTALGAVLLVNHNDRMLALHEAEDKALILLNRNLATHAYFSSELKPGVLELAGGRLPPGYFDPSWMSSTYAVRQIDGIFKDMKTGEDYYYKECAINARSPENEADPTERAFIEEMKRNPGLTTRSEIREIGGKPHLMVMRRGETMEPPCIACHGDPGKAPGGLLSRFGEERSFHRSVGELVSAISIRVPLSKAYGDARRFSWGLSALLLVLFAALGAAMYVLNRRLLLKPLVAVRDEARRISVHGGSGEEIPLPAMQELRDLTDAFNAMSADVARQQAELERRVAERTRDLSEANLRLETEIAERRRAEERLVESRKMEAVGRLAGGVAHEFNNMLTVINGYSEVLLSRTKETDPIRKELDTIRNTGLRAAKLTRQLLAFGRKQMLRPELLDMNEVIAGLENTLRRLLGETIALVVLPGDGLGKLRSDPAQVEEVFLNVAMNAKEAMPFGGTFTLQTRNVILDESFPCRCGQVAPGPYVMVTATDSGGGMDAETIDHLFEPFYTTKPFGEGKGLGLPTVYGIVMQSGGHIAVDSRPGRGTTVRFCFPAIP